LRLVEEPGGEGLDLRGLGGGLGANDVVGIRGCRARETPGVEVGGGRLRRRKSLRPRCTSSAFTWWLIAAWVTFNSSPALVKLRWRAAASKARSALSNGRRRGIGDLYG
jgi:hypothetical protein